MTAVTLLSTRHVYDGRVVSLDVDTVRQPNGRVTAMELVRHPGASAVLALLSRPDDVDPTILLIRQFRHAANGYVYEIPAGRLMDGEDPAACAQRELREETGYAAGRVSPLLSFLTTPGFTDEQIHAYLAWDLHRGDPSPDPDEVIEVETRPLSEALRMIELGQIRDGKTIATLLYATIFRRTG